MDNMEMEKLRAVEVQKDLIHQLEDIRMNADRILAKLTEARDEGKLTPTDGTVNSDKRKAPLRTAVRSGTFYRAHVECGC